MVTGEGYLPDVGTGSSQDFREIWHSSIGFYRIWILHLGRRYKILQKLAKLGRPASAHELRKSLALAEPAVARWCEAAFAVGLIDKEGSKYSLPRSLIPLLIDEDDVRFVGGLPSYLALRSLDFGLFDQFFRSGQVPRTQAHLGEAFREGTIYDHVAFVKLILTRDAELRRLFRGRAKVLDIGSGEGGWSLKLARLYPRSTFLGIDPHSGAIAEAARRAEQGGLKNVKFSVQRGEAMKFSEEFDVAYFGEVLNLISEGEEAVRSCHSALKTGGVLVVCEGLARSGPEARKPKNQLVQAMQLDFALQGGKIFTRTELAELLSDNGFPRARFHDVGGGLWFAVARKK